MGLRSPRVGVVGGTGKMGGWFVRYFEDKGFQVSLTGKETAHGSAEMVRRCDVVVLSVPISSTWEVIRELGPLVRKEALLMDLTSLKQAALKEMLNFSRSEVVGAHPLFGPEADLNEGLKIALCPGRGDRWLNWLKDLFEESGVKPVVLSAEEHDRRMAIVQGVNHFLTIALALLIQRSGLGLDDLLLCGTQSFLRRVDRIRSLLVQSPDLFRSILMDNPDSEASLKGFLEEAEKLKRIIERRDLQAFKEDFDELRTHFQATGD